MARIEVTCPKCFLHVAVKTTLRTKSNLLYIFSCGHVSTEELLVKKDEVRIEDLLWYKLFDYQKIGVEFIEKSNFNCLIGDEMGLGKTIQAIFALRRNHDKDLFPALIVVPPPLIYKWQREFKIWYNDKFNEMIDAPIIHLNSSGGLLEGQNIHIISNAIIGRETEGHNGDKEKALLEEIKAYEFKTLIVDESHQFKNDSANRTKALIEIAKTIPHHILLSGTSIMNRTTEYFNTLHIVNPQHWPTKHWLNAYCAFDRNGRILGLADSRKEAFFLRTKDYIIRRRKEEVLPDLPEKQVNYQFINLNDNKQFVKSYNRTLDELVKVLEQKGPKQHMFIIALMAELRHCVGLAKTQFIADKAIEFLESTSPDDKVLKSMRIGTIDKPRESNRKLAIGVHHKLVMDFIIKGINERIESNKSELNGNYELKDLKIVHMSDEQAKIKDEIEDQFRRDENTRCAVLSILGCGQGRDMQFCSNVIIAEREWNHAIENQFEDRFHRIGTKEKVTIDYILAQNTIDEFSHTMVQLKEQITNSVLDYDFASDEFLMLELAELLVKKRLKYVGA